MNILKKIFAINGSASANSTNLQLLNRFSERTKGEFEVVIFDKLSELPPFNPELSIEGSPQSITDLRQAIAEADAVLICTPEYVFSIPSGLKNAIEWCVATTVFSNKLVGLITASTSGAKGHEELKMIMKTLDARFSDEITLLISGIKSKMDKDGNITDHKTEDALSEFIESFKKIISA